MSPFRYLTARGRGAVQKRIDAGNCIGPQHIELLFYRHPMKLRDWSLRRWALVIALIILLPLIGLRLQLKWRVHRAVAELKEAGLPTRFTDLNRLYGMSDSTRNFAYALTNAMAAFSDDDKSLTMHIPFWGDAPKPQPGSAWPAEMRAAVTRYFEVNQTGMVLLHDALSLTNACYFGDYDPAQWTISTLVQAKKAAQRLGLSAVSAAEQGRLPDASRSLGAVFAIAETLADEPSVIGHLVRLAIESDGLDYAEHVFSYGVPNAGDLNFVRHTFQQRIRDTSLHAAISGERVYFLEPAFYGYGEVTMSGSEWWPVDDPWEAHWEKLKVLAYRISGLADRDVLFFIQTSRQLQDTAARSLHHQYELSTNWPSVLPVSGTQFRYWSRQGLGVYEDLFESNVRITSKLRVADAALAVAQYRLQHEGKLSASLDELVPKFLETVPIEPQSGRPVELIVTADGYGIGRGTPVFSVKLNGAR